MTLRALVADDDTDVRRLIRFALEDAGWEVVEAAHGGEVLELVPGRELDVVILDSLMPVMDGRETCRRLAAAGGPAAPPVVFLTARVEPWLEDGSVNAVGYLLKPFDIDRLARDILAILDRNRD